MPDKKARPGQKGKAAGGKPADRPAPEAGKRPPSIGTQKESCLHRSLKFRYSGGGGETETPEGGYVCDARTGGGELIEVQTGSFGPLKEKVKNLTLTNKVRIVHPIFTGKVIELYGTDGRLIRRRKSPKKGTPWDLFGALVHAPELPLLKNLAIELALVEAVEHRVSDGKGSWRRKGARITDRFLSAWQEPVILGKPEDYRRFAPFKKNETFSVRTLAENTGISAALARKTLYVLTKMGLVERTGKERNAWLYRRVR